MRTKSAQASAVIANPSHSARALVTVYSSAGVAGPTWGSGSAEGNMDPVLGVDIEQSIDSFRTARIRLQRQQGRYSLSPLNVSGNPLYGSEAPVTIGRRVVIEAELCLPDISATPSGLKETVFDGYIDEVTWPEDEMLLVCTDKSARLRDTWIEAERVYCFATGAYATKGVLVWRYDLPALAVGDLVIPSDKNFNGHFYRVTAATSPQAVIEPAWPTGGASTVVSGGVTFTESGAVSETGTALETLIQQVLNDNGLGSLVALQTPVSPSWVVRPYVQQRESVMDAISTMVAQLGWRVSFEWSSGLSKYELTLFEPDRASSTTHKTLDATEELECTELGVDVWSIRNVVRVIYSNTGARTPKGDPIRVVREVSDSSSITKYGRRFMEIAEGDASAIDTDAEADRLANAALADLKEPTCGLGLTFPCDFYLELGDRIQVPADNLRFTSSQTLAIESLKHSFTAESARTTVTLRGAPAAMRELWLERDGLVNPSDVHRVGLMNANSSSIEVSPVVGGTRFALVDARNKQAFDASHEVHVSDTSGFTPSASTLVAAGNAKAFDVPDLVPGKTYYYRVVPYSQNASRLVQGSPSVEASFVAARAKSGHYDAAATQSHLPLNGNFEHAIADLATDPPDHWQVVTRPSEATETWGSAGSVYYGTDTSKGRYVRLRESGTQRGNLVSSAFEVRRGVRSLNIYLSIRRNGASAVSGKDLIVDILGYSDSALATQIINYSVTLSGSGSGPYPSLATWYDIVIDFGAGYGAVPTNVNFLQLGLRRGTTGDSAYSWDIGDVYVQEADFYRATIDQTPWTAVTFQNSFSDFDAANYQACAYFKDSMGIVHLKGFAKRATAALATAIFTLPSGFRPAKISGFPSVANSKFARVQVTAAGVVTVEAADDASWFTFFTLDGITFDTR